MKTLPLDDEAADLALAGGKGASLARLARAGLPVPGGFHVTTDAYLDFVSRDGLNDQIMAAVSGMPPEEASRHIAALFAARQMPAETAAEIRAAHARLGANVPVAVRSSATSEDLPDMSFAGQQDTYLNVRADALPDAVSRCWASLWTARAIAYRAANGVPHDGVALAVVVQELVEADAAGVLFTANPLTGARDQVVINASWGLGEALVGGQVTPDTVVVGKAAGADGEIAEEHIGDKTVMTVRTPGGTRAEPVPEELRRRRVLDREQALLLARLATEIEKLYGTAMDVEWARRDGAFLVLQARPITRLRQRVEEWNDSLTGDYLWTGTNLREAIPDVMTPCTWSLVQIFIGEAMSASKMPGFSVVGNIGGRFYMNLSIAFSVARAMGMQSRLGAIEQVFGKLPPGLDVPLLPISRWQIVKGVLPLAFTLRRRVAVNTGRMRPFLATARERCTALRERTAATATTDELVRLWEAELLPYFVEACQVLEAAGRQGGNALVMTRDRLRELVGERDAQAMLTGANTDGALASLETIIGLERLAAKEIDRETFAGVYGHRGAHEFEVSIARPGEDPRWIDAQLAAMPETRGHAGTLLDRQREAHEAAWRRFGERHPGKVAKTRERVARWNAIVRDRETARSEVMRAFWALRAFVLRAGKLTGHGDDLFFLRIEEIPAVVGTGNATMRLRDGDRIRVDGERGTVELLAPHP
ncbi:PEP-utilizing enzyme [Streptosporangium sp. NBC_01755]|uniref:PEP/pyruvate-binding domain-containing protein n=1 Tax=Streptosporangium sp. NBC_01755 TaxID=2975949 RepID=UPI002DD7EDB7|nr:PEP/pyruvate-binding domain-containing protein [Streptosporangium sp. NBC_01755]WSC98629.1 PEP-utilizing enzyme [Streptosporangium sp. NBC_01755]